MGGQTVRNGESAGVDVLLLSMPFGPLHNPSLALGLLEAALAPLGLSTHTVHFTIPFAERIGRQWYRIITGGLFATHDLLGEWLFSQAAFGQQSEAEVQHYLDQVIRGQLPAHAKPIRLGQSQIATILRVRQAVEPFLQACVDDVLACRPRIIGFTSVFQQQVASLALAKRLKALLPDVRIVFGGGNCEGVMGAEVIRQFPFVDAVVSGEGDLVFPQLIERLLQGDSLADLRGVYSQGTVPMPMLEQGPTTAEAVWEMDQLPMPSYDQYFAQVQQSTLELGALLRLPFQTSRGCWWGEKQHCTFCGLNRETIAPRSKSADRALTELRDLTRRYPGIPVTVMDNILDMRYFKDFLPALAAQPLGVTLFYEVKANLKKWQVRLLRDAGIRRVQPGIESMSDAVLQRMRKGVTGLQNMQFLKWCKEFGIAPSWNILWGFPGESPAEYQRMAQLVPLLTHLPPPGGCTPIRMDRFSPHFTQADAFGFKDIEPYPAYSHIYPLAVEAIRNLAYFFTYDYQQPQPAGHAAAVALLQNETSAWVGRHADSDLFFLDQDAQLQVWDFRPLALTPLTRIQGLDRLLYLACDAQQSVRGLAEHLTTMLGQVVERTEVAERLARLVQQRLMARVGEMYLSLALPVGEYMPNSAVRRKLRHAVTALAVEPDAALGHLLEAEDHAPAPVGA